MGSYRFDYYSAFLHVMTYVALNNATEWLARPLAEKGTATGYDFLLAMVRTREGYPSSPASPWLADYGPNKRDYLEVVPSYVDVVPALQFGSVGMALATARLADQNGAPFGNGSGAALAVLLRANASAIASAAQEHLWRDDDSGAWRCIYPNGTSAPVRSVNDYVYIAQSIGFLGRDASFSLPANVSRASVDFFERELLAPGTAWVRALSLDDQLCSNVQSLTPSIEDLLVMRADWGCFGA